RRLGRNANVLGELRDNLGIPLNRDSGEEVLGVHGESLGVVSVLRQRRSMQQRAGCAPDRRLEQRCYISILARFQTREPMGKGRLEAFSDGVIDVIITVMVLELKVPHGIELLAMLSSLLVLLRYVIRFIFLTLYWRLHNFL